MNVHVVYVSTVIFEFNTQDGIPLPSRGDLMEVWGAEYKVRDIEFVLSNTGSRHVNVWVESRF